ERHEPREQARSREPDEEDEHEEERKDVLDGFEAAQQLTEDPAGEVARGDVAEEERRGDHDGERTADPEGERKADDERRKIEQNGPGVYRDRFRGLRSNDGTGAVRSAR